MADELEVSGVEEVQATAAESQTNEPPAAASNEPPAADERVEAAFAKRLAAERSKIEQEYSDRYRDYDKYKTGMDYFVGLNELNDVNELMERIEMERLQERASQAQVSPEVQRRLEELEAKAAEADTLREQQQLQSVYQELRGDLERFAAEKNFDADAIEQFMVDNGLQSKDWATNMEIAYRNLTWQDVQGQLEQIKKDAINEYLKSKDAPKVMGSGGVAHIPATPPKTWQEADRGALEMLRRSNS